MAYAPPMDEIKDVLDAYARNGSNAAATARELGMPASTVRLWVSNSERWMNQASEDGTIGADARERKTDNTAGKSRVINMVTHDELVTVDDVLDHCQIDRSEWEVVECKITSHKQGQTDEDKNARIVSMVNVSLKLKRRDHDDPMRAKREVMEILKTHAPKIPKPSWTRRKSMGDLILEISVPDIHMGKLADRSETGEDYNLQIARSLYLKAHEHILEQACGRYEIGQIIQVPSNDIMHFEGSTYATTRGTRQDSCATWQRVYTTARKTAVDSILMCRKVAPVHVVSHVDNHAQDASFYLGDALDCYFHADDHTVVDAGPQPYKFHRHGNCLIGWGHGHQAKYPELQAVMARSCPIDYAECSVKEWHLGHLHKEMLIDGWGGLVFRRISSLSGTDSWHAGMGYSSQKSAMGFVWSRDALEAVVYFTPKPEDYVA